MATLEKPKQKKNKRPKTKVHTEDASITHDESQSVSRRIEGSDLKRLDPDIESDSDQIKSDWEQINSFGTESIQNESRTEAISTETETTRTGTSSPKSTKLETIRKESESTQIESVSTPRESLSTQIESVSTQRESLSTQIESVSTQRESVSTQIESVSTRRESVSTQIESVSTEVESVSTQIDSESNQNESESNQNESELNQNESESNQNESESNLIESEMTQLETESNQMNVESVQYGSESTQHGSESVRGSVSTRGSESTDLNFTGTKCIKIGSKTIEISTDLKGMENESESTFYDESSSEFKSINDVATGSSYKLDSLDINGSIGNSDLVNVENYEDISCKNVKIHSEPVLRNKSPKQTELVKVFKDKNLEVVASLVYPVLPSVDSLVAPSAPQESLEDIRPLTEVQLSALYSNRELEAVQEFGRCFADSELRRGTGGGRAHRLRQLLSEYSHIRAQLRDTSRQLQEAIERAGALGDSDGSWQTDTGIVSGGTKCLCGVQVMTKYRYRIAKLRPGAVQQLETSLSLVRQLVNEQLVSCTHRCDILRNAIERYIFHVTCTAGLAIPSTRPELKEQPRPEMRDLRACISELFWQQRSGAAARDPQLANETRRWLTAAVSALLHAADWQDHAYVLNHILRCPGGISSWAVAFLQVPVPIKPDRLLDHALAMLAILLTPPHRRDEFLSRSGDPSGCWVVVDSDGEDDTSNNGSAPLKENDLVALLNQIPLADLFRSAMPIENQTVSEHDLLRFYAFCTTLLKLLEEGLCTYGSIRYNQFAKRLGRLASHTLQYAADVLETAVGNEIELNPNVAMRLQLELDELILRGVKCLFSAGRRGALGVWQFLAVLPFRSASGRQLWRFYAAIHGVNSEDTLKSSEYWKQTLEDTETRTQFEELLLLLGADSSYYLLSALANTASARPSTEPGLAVFALAELLNIGFVRETTRDSCSKSCFALLGLIITRSPQLTSELIKEINASAGKLDEDASNGVLRLFGELPLGVWKPDETDWKLLREWLTLCGPGDWRHRLARLIIGALDLIHFTNEEHDRIALLVAECAERLESWAGLPPRDDERAPTSDRAAAIWAWRLIFALRLHASHRDGNATKSPELGQLPIIESGVRARKPFALLLSLLMTSTGHLIPMVCSHGFSILNSLIELGATRAAITGLNALLPLFVECSDSLAACSGFRTAISSLLILDKPSYVRSAARSLVGDQPPGPIAKELGLLLHVHLASPRLRPLASAWLRALIGQSNWQRDTGIMYLLDLIVQLSFGDQVTYSSLSEALSSRLDEQSGGQTSGILGWVSGSGGQANTLLGGTAAQPQWPWLANLCLEVEFEKLEKRTNLWQELLIHLHETSGKTNVDSSLKKASTSVKYSWLGGSSALCIYRWASQATETPLDHPLLPILWQKFFELYLERVPSRMYEQHMDRGCVGAKFFDGVVNSTFCKKLKKRLCETVTYCESNGKENLIKLFHTFKLWLEEPLLREPALYLPSLPPQYDATHLGRILRGDKDPWLEYLNSDVLRSEHEQALSEWNELFRWPSKARSPPPSTNLVELPRNRMKRHLSSYDKPQPPSVVSIERRPHDAIPIYGEEMKAIQAVGVQLSKLKQLAELHCLQSDAHLALDRQWLETIPTLWHPVKTDKVIEKTCGATCTGAARVHLRYTEWRLNKVSITQAESCRMEVKALVERVLKPGEGPAARPCSLLDAAVEELCSVTENGSATKDILHIATEMYHTLIAAYENPIVTFPAARDTLKSCTDLLGAKFILGAERQQCRLCRTLLKRPMVAPLVLQHYHPVAVSSEILLQMYSDIVDGIDNAPDIGLILLSRIQVADWLNGRKPRLSERSRLIRMIFTLLTKPDTITQLQETIRTHLLDSFRHEFPEHYGEVIQLALTNSSSNTLPPIVWSDLVKSIWGTKGTPRELAARQRLLQYEVLRESATTLGRYFSTERLQHCSVYGIYSRFRPYVTQLSQLLHLLSLSLISAATETYRGALADTIVQLVWPPLLEVFAPWLLPNWPPDNQTRTSPWINPDSQLARHQLSSFIDSIGFILDTLPGNRTVLSYVWQLYVGSFAIPSIDVHVIRSVNTSLIMLPWSRFWPSLRDLELMAGMADQYLPENHGFLARVFQSIDWSNWLTGLSPGPTEILTRALSSLLQLLVKLSGEGELDDSKRLLETALQWSWNVVEPPVLSMVIDWWVMSVDPQIVLQLHTDTIEELNQAVIRLIETASAYVLTPVPNNDPNSILKRQCVIRAYVKLLVGCSSRHKTLLQKQSKLVQNSITYHLQRIDNLFSASGASETSADPLVSEILTLVNNTNLNDSVITAIETWLTSHQSDNFAVGAVMRTTCITVTEGESCGRLLEMALEVFFGRSSTTPRKDGWELAVKSVRWGGGIALEKTLGTNGQLLTLHCLLLKRLPSIEQALEWTSDAKPTQETTEPKLVLIWKDVLEAALRLVNSGEMKRAVAGLRKFSRQLCTLADESGGWGRAVLGAIMGSKRGVSIRTRLLARAIAGFILAQIPESRDDSSDVLRLEPNALGAVGQPGGNTECPKLLLKLDCGVELRNITETALRRIQDPSATIHDAVRFLYDITGLLYSEPYLIRND